MTKPPRSRVDDERPRPLADAIRAGALVLCVFLVYWPALNGGRLLDDDLHITPASLQSISGLARIWFHLGATQQYYPVLHTAFWLEHRAWGDWLPGYHAINLLLHAGSAVLIVALMRRLRLRGAWLAAFLFALHPVCVESVAWIAEQKNTLATAFALGAAICYLDFDEQRRPARYVGATALFALALLSKTAVVALPVALLALVWWRRSQFNWRCDALPLAPWLALGAFTGLATLSIEHGLLAGVQAHFALTPVDRCLIAGRAFWFYLFKLAVPIGLTFFYPRWTVDAFQAWQYLFLFAAVMVAFWCWRRSRRHQRGPMAALICFGAALLPVLGYFDLEWYVFAYVADHLEYLAVVAFVVPVAVALAAGPRGRGAAWGLIVVLGFLTWRQAQDYRDAETLYRSVIRFNPASAAAHNNLGTVLAAMPGREPEAIAEFEAALRFNPRVAEGQENLGSVLIRDPARVDEALEHLEEARSLDPNRKSVHLKLAMAFADRPGRADEAAAEFGRALRIDPSDAAAHNGLGRLWLRDPRRLGDAEREFEAAVTLDPKFAAAHNNLGDVWMKVPGHLSGATIQFQEALRLDPQMADAHNNLGLALARGGAPLDQVMPQFETALQLDPKLAGAHCNLGMALMLVPGRMSEGISQLREGLRLDPGFAPGWILLGNSLLRTGDPAGAETAFRKALRLSPDNAAAQMGLEACSRGR
ncbi:MAG TPA: tetratricopeptide repeat protein [Opitutaceae bacterium]|jgi:tetratricopeptide (TPR) repeat protein